MILNIKYGGRLVDMDLPRRLLNGHEITADIDHQTRFLPDFNEKASMVRAKCEGMPKVSLWEMASMMLISDTREPSKLHEVINLAIAFVTGCMNIANYFSC